ncbi:MAG: two-component system sensor histidine kinase NtrB [Bryobacteraceae bacterium]
MSDHPVLNWLQPIKPQDLVWLLLFGALAASTPTGDPWEIAMLVALAIMQVLEPKLPVLASQRGRIYWNILKLALGMLLIGYTGGIGGRSGIGSRYWLVLMLPMIYPATTLGVGGTLAFTLVALASYLVFLVPGLFDWARYTLDKDTVSELVLRVAFLAMVGNLVNILAEDLRIQNQKFRRTAEDLAEANRHIQEAEEAVRRSDRLAALGQLSAGLAHELRNPLGTIKVSSEMLGRSVGAENEVAREVAGFIATEVDRCNSLITRFLQFARPLQLQLEDADLAQVLDRAIVAVEREVPGIAVYKNYAPEIPPFPVDAELLERVFYNLVLNAVQASPPKGAVTVKTRAAGGTAEIAVIDRGAGIDPRQLDTIFNPFFTTKPAGVGLGLAIVSKIVDEHGGKITVESELGKGSVFRVLLPIERPKPSEPPESSP